MKCNWLVKDMIRRGVINFRVGDEVILLKRKGNGYPKSIKDGEVYIIIHIENDQIIVAQHSLDGIGWMPSMKVHKTYLISKLFLRDIKINSILR